MNNKLYLPPNSDGLFYRTSKKCWYVSLITEDGHKVVRSLKTPDELEARSVLRTLNYPHLPFTQKDRIKERPDMYIHEVKLPFSVKINGVLIGKYHTKEEAVKARNKALGIKLKRK